jgi:hypothetical protein
MHYYRRVLNDMIQAFRTFGPDRIEYLLNVIRSIDSLEEIVVALEVNMAEVRGEGEANARSLPDLRQASVEAEQAADTNPRKRRMVMSIQSLSDEPLFDLPAKPWTSVTDDDHFVSHLVSLYFTWEHAACHIIDRELFLADMKNGHLDSQCCSPLLVNALLATACVRVRLTSVNLFTINIWQSFSDYPEACAVQGKSVTRGDQFFAEAKLLWEKEKGANSLANCGALCMMAIM